MRLKLLRLILWSFSDLIPDDVTIGVLNALKEKLPENISIIVVDTDELLDTEAEDLKESMLGFDEYDYRILN